MGFFKKLLRRSHALREEMTSRPAEDLTAQTEAAQEPSNFALLIKNYMNWLRQDWPDHFAFLRDKVGSENLSRLAFLAEDKMAHMKSDSRSHSIGFSDGSAWFVGITTIPCDSEYAKHWYMQNHGGYLNYLTQFLTNVKARGTFNVIIHITYGEDSRPWINLCMIGFGDEGPLKSYLIPDWVEDDDLAQIGIRELERSEIGEIQLRFRRSCTFGTSKT